MAVRILLIAYLSPNNGTSKDPEGIGNVVMATVRYSRLPVLRCGVVCGYVRPCVPWLYLVAGDGSPAQETPSFTGRASDVGCTQLRCLPLALLLPSASCCGPSPSNATVTSIAPIIRYISPPTSHPDIIRRAGRHCGSCTLVFLLIRSLYPLGSILTFYVPLLPLS